MKAIFLILGILITFSYTLVGQELFRHKNPYFRFTIPIDWEKAQSKGEHILVTLSSKDGEANMNVNVDINEEYKNITAHDLTSDLLLSGFRQTTKVELINTIKTKITNIDALILEYQYTMQNLDSKLEITCMGANIVYRDKLYMINFFSLTKSYSKNKKLFEDILKSFVIEEDFYTEEEKHSISFVEKGKEAAKLICECSSNFIKTKFSISPKELEDAVDDYSTLSEIDFNEKYQSVINKFEYIYESKSTEIENEIIKCKSLFQSIYLDIAKEDSFEESFRNEIKLCKVANGMKIFGEKIKK